MINAQDILDFWFSDTTKPFWFTKNDDFDQRLHHNFTDIHRQATQVELWSWRKTAQGRLAEIILLDQFSRNLYRNKPAAFAQDGLALALSQEAITLKLDLQLSPEQRVFLYMPFMHSESAVIHQLALDLFEQLGNSLNLDFEKQHKDIIDRFGRYPHRNAILGRSSTEEERLFLQQPNSSF